MTHPRTELKRLITMRLGEDLADRFIIACDGRPVSVMASRIIEAWLQNNAPETADAPQ